MSADTEALLATVREALRRWDHLAPAWHATPESLAALDSLAAELEQERHANQLLGSANETLAARNAELVAELERVKAERDEYVAQWANVCSIEFLDYWQTIGKSCSAGEAIQDLLADKARLDKALSALREIKSTPTGRQKVATLEGYMEADGVMRTIAHNAIVEIEWEARVPHQGDYEPPEVDDWLPGDARVAEIEGEA